MSITYSTPPASATSMETMPNPVVRSRRNTNASSMLINGIRKFAALASEVCPIDTR